MIGITLYNKELKFQRHTRTKSVIEDKAERLRQQQKDYYQRKGFFFEYKRKVCRKIGVDYEALKDIKSVYELETFALDYLEKNHNVRLENGKAVAYILRVL
jgi:hypothetical protein